MEYVKMKEVGGRLVKVNVKTVKQAELSSECWVVQFEGLSACETCELRDTEECGGPSIRKSGKNELGNDVPV